MRCHNHNWMDNTTFEFPRTGFWLFHIIGGAALFIMGMRFAMRRAPLSFAAYRFLRMLTRR